MPEIYVDARCGNCEFFRNGCAEMDVADCDDWCPSWEPMEIDPDADEEEEG